MTKPDLNKRLREYRKSLNLVEWRGWVPAKVRDELEEKYPRPILPAGYARSKRKG